MLSDNEVKRIKNNEETDRLAREERDDNRNKVEAETEQEKETQERLARFVKKVIFMSVITVGTVFSAALLLLVFRFRILG